jgi:hypothetical protein
MAKQPWLFRRFINLGRVEDAARAGHHLHWTCLEKCRGRENMITNHAPEAPPFRAGKMLTLDANAFHSLGIRFDHLEVRQNR